MRSECGARGRSRKPLPGGSGSPLGRHDDRSPRSSVDSRQIEAGNTRQIGSQETRVLELSQRRMRSPWRVPRRSAERRAARDMSRCRARSAKRMATFAGVARTWMECAYRRSASLLCRGRACFWCVVKAELGHEVSRERFRIFRHRARRAGGPCEAWWREHAALRLTVRPRPLPPRFGVATLPRRVL
jgi:hypothetical protein